MLNGIGADLQCKFILLTEDAIKDKTQGKSTQAVVEDNHGP